MYTGCTTINLSGALLERAFCHTVKICWLLIGASVKVKCFWKDICLSINKINRILLLKTFATFLSAKKYYASGPLKFRLGINCDPGLFTLENILLRKMPHKTTFLAATGKMRYCLLNVMAQFGSFSPDKIWQVDDLT